MKPDSQRRLIIPVCLRKETGLQSGDCLRVSILSDNRLQLFSANNNKMKDEEFYDVVVLDSKGRFVVSKMILKIINPSECDLDFRISAKGETIIVRWQKANGKE